MSERVVFHMYMQHTKTMRVPDPWFRQLRYVINVTDRGPSNLPGAELHLDRSWDVRVDILHNVGHDPVPTEQDAKAPRPVVRTVQVVQYCSMQLEPFATHNSNQLKLSKVSSSSWEVHDFVQRQNDYIQIAVERYFSHVPVEIEMSVSAK